MPASLPLPLLASLGLILALLPTRCLAFAPPPPPATAPRTPPRRRNPPPAALRPTALSSARGAAASVPPPAQSSLERLGSIRTALKRPRGASAGAEYAPAADADRGDGDLSVLSMQLRRAGCAAIWTSDAVAAGKIGREQEGARGDFPGPVPVVYSGPVEDLARGENGGGVAAVVLECGQDVDMESLDGFGIIWKVDDSDQLRELSGAENSGGVFLLSRDMLPQSVEEDAEELKETLSNLPKSTVTIAPLSTMLPENGEIALGKHYASIGVSSLLLEGACVGDEEDAPYSQYAIEELKKKSSSSFSMTGLTGSTNGHFGVSSHGGEARWRRNG